MATEPPAKRHREDEADDGGATSTSSIAWTRHPELWLERGDIIIVRDNTGFCVGQCILALYSPVFREMFRMVDPAQNETSDGLPIVRLHDDVEDLYHLLKAMHFRQYVRKTSKPTFKALAAILKLSTKYMIDDLHEEVVDVLTAIFPTNFSSMADRSSGYVPDDLDTLYAVELAKQYNVPIILPAAYMMSSLHPVKKIMDPAFSVASTATRCSCAVFRDELMNTVDKVLRRSRDTDQWLFKADSRDKSGNWRCAEDHCCAILDTWVQNIELRIRRLAHEDLFSPSLRRLSSKQGCKVLETRFSEHWAGIQLDIWDNLPSLCGYENWEAANAAQTVSAVAQEKEKKKVSAS